MADLERRWVSSFFTSGRAIAVRLGSGGPFLLLLLYLDLGLLPLLGYFALDILDGGIGTLTTSTYLGVVCAAIGEELSFRLILPGVVGGFLWFSGLRLHAHKGVLASLWFLSIAWVFAHPLQGQPWVKLIELIPAAAFYAILWHRTIDDFFVGARDLSSGHKRAFSLVDLRSWVYALRFGMLAIVAHAGTNLLAEFMWRGAISS